MKKIIQQAFEKLGYRIEGIRYTPRQFLDPNNLRALSFDDVVCRHMFEKGEDISFIQIGAFDGVSTDPLRSYIKRCPWTGVMVEPQPRPATALRELYLEESRIVIIEAAVDSNEGTRTLYTVDCDELPRWAGGMASFDKSHILKHDYLLPNLEAHLRSLEVQSVTFDTVLGSLPNPAKLDLLQIDAEGADGRIIEIFPFDRVLPSIVQWEVKNLTKLQQESVLDRLISHGYKVARSGDEDMLAVL